MKRFCEECGVEQQWELDSVRGEMCCEGCGLTLDYIPNDADTNSSISAGDERQNERVNALEGRGPGTVMNAMGDRFDAQGNRLSADAFRLYRRLGRVNRSTHREKDPMYRQLVATLRELFGENLALTVEFLTRATAQKLTPMQEAIRRTLSPSEQKLLACPKTSITRKPSGVKGESDRQNLVLMAIAIAELAHEWFGALHIDRAALLAEHGLTQTQFKNAKRTISQHYKARCRQKFAPIPRPDMDAEMKAYIKNGIRHDKVDVHTDRLFNELDSRLTDAQHNALNKVYDGMLTAIGEPSTDAYTANMDESMLCSVVMLAALTALDLEHQNLAALGRAVGDRSGAGIKSRLAQLRYEVERGIFPQGAALFEKHRSPHGREGQADETQTDASDEAERTDRSSDRNGSSDETSGSGQ
jgi:hypothetical protein